MIWCDGERAGGRACHFSEDEDASEIKEDWIQSETVYSFAV